MLPLISQKLFQMKLKIQTPKGKEVTTLDVNPATFSVDDLKKKLAGLKGMSVDRVGVSYFNAKGTAAAWELLGIICRC